jgi:hypothetical protein
MKRITLIVLIVATLVGCETSPKRPLTWQERLVRAEENRVRALRAMLIMQGIAHGMQAAGNRLQQSYAYRPPVVFHNPATSSTPAWDTFQSIRQMQLQNQSDASLHNMGSKIDRLDRYFRFNASNFY